MIAARSLEPGPASGLYIGCGNGRNFVPLVKRGIELTGLDVSATAIAQLRERLPERSNTVIHGDLTSTALSDSYPIVIGIQVFQHGSRVTFATRSGEAPRSRGRIVLSAGEREQHRRLASA